MTTAGNIQQVSPTGGSPRHSARAGGDTIRLDQLPADMLPVTPPAEPMRAAAGIESRPLTDELGERMIGGGESFRRVVYPAFMGRHLT
jgi:hypothetical protein